MPRLLLHGLVIATVSGAVWVGRTGSQPTSLSLLAGKGGNEAVLDEVAAASVAAEVATQADLLISQEASQTATSLSSQVALPTTDEEHLAKRAVVQTAGDASRGVTTYTVLGGDTLSGIASKFNVTTSTVTSANNIDDVDSLKPGQGLTILPISGLMHTVLASDTAESLAAKFQANAAQILSYNNAEAKGLVPGSQIIIPDGVKPEVAKPRPAVVTTQLASGPRVPTLTRFTGGANGYSYGYCTWYVASRRAVPTSWGNASSWYYNARAAGWGTGRAPVPGAIAWTSGMSYWGHVGIVEAVNGNQVLVADMNGPGGWGRVSRYWTSASSWAYIY